MRRVTAICDGSLFFIREPSPRLHKVLHNLLSYNRAAFAKKRPGRAEGMQSIPVECYVLEEVDGQVPKLIAQSGYLYYLTEALKKFGYDLRVKKREWPKDVSVYAPNWNRVKDVKWRYKQRETVLAMLANDHGRICWPTGAGKALPMTASVWTPSGPRPMGTMRVGDTICGPDGDVSTVTGVFPQGVVSGYRVTFDNGDSVDCCADHLWEVDSKKLSFARPKILTTAQIAKTYLSPAGDRMYAVRVPRPLMLTKRELPIDPYVMGVLLGNGCFRGGTPSITQMDKSVVRRVRTRLLPGYELRLQPSTADDTSPQFNLTSTACNRSHANVYKSVLEDLGLWNKLSVEKHIPQIYLLSDARDRLELLRGLMDTDGWVEKTGSCYFAVSSAQFAQDMKQLVESLGGLADMRPAKKTTHADSYGMCVRFDDAKKIFTVPRKRARIKTRTKYFVKRMIARVETIGAVAMQCIKTSHPTGLFVTDHCVVTHNTFTITQLCRLLPKARIDIATNAIDVITDIYLKVSASCSQVALHTSKSPRMRPSRINCVGAQSLHKMDGQADILICDEAHELATDNAMARLARYRYAKMFAFSANRIGDRADKADFELRGVFGEELSYISYQEAVDNDMVVPMEVRWYTCAMATNPCEGASNSVVKKRRGIWRNDTRNRLIAKVVNEFADDDQVLIVVDTIEHAMRLKKELPNFTLCYGDTLDDKQRKTYERTGCIGPTEPEMNWKRRQRIKRQFEKGRLKKVIATGVWNRGVDFRNLAVLVRADGKNSRIADTQIPGRVARTRFDGATKTGIVIDFIDSFDENFASRSTARRRCYGRHKWKQVAMRFLDGRSVPRRASQGVLF